MDSLFNPRSVALIGASRKANSVGYAVFRNVANSFEGDVFPVNKNALSIDGKTCYNSVLEIENDIDLAVIMVPRDCVVETLEECGHKGITSAVIITAGFKEIGDEGKSFEEEIIQIANKYSISLVGPNCLGIINTNIGLNATFAAAAPKKGNISFISQSGAVGVYALEFASNNDIGFAKFVSIGNKSVLNENDILRYLGKDKSTKVIMIYLESFSNPAEFIKLAAEISFGTDPKPIILIKAGRSSSGKRAAVSHTGALAGSDEMVDDLMEQCGVLRVKDMEEMFNYVMCLANQPLPKGPNTAIVTNAGGPGIMAADDAERAGLTVPELSSTLQSNLIEKLTTKPSVKNPVDLIGDADAMKYLDALNILIDSDEVDSLVVLCTPQMMTNLELVAGSVADVSDKARIRNKTLVASFAAFNDHSSINKILDEKDIPNYRFSENAIEAIAAAYRYSMMVQKNRNGSPIFSTDKMTVKEIIYSSLKNESFFLTEPESYKVFEAYGIPVAKYRFCRTFDETCLHAKEIGYPLVMKVVSHDIVHKVDVGGVFVNIKNEKELAECHHNLYDNIYNNDPETIIEGVLIQEMIRDGVEVITGVKYEEGYGHIIMFGLGGTYVEVFKDVKFRLAPITEDNAEELIYGIKSSKLLTGYRGKPAKDITALKELLLRISQLVTDFPEISEIDLNPVFAMAKGAKTADARIMLRKK